MSKSAKKTQIKLYKIDKHHFVGKTNIEIERFLIKKANVGLDTTNEYRLQKTRSDFDIPKKYEMVVYHTLKEGEPGWVKSWTDVLDKDSGMLTSKNHMSSYIALIGNKKNLYALTGGQGNVSIAPYTESFFGLDVIDHLLTSLDSSELSQSTRAAVAGNVKTEQRAFFNLTDGLSQDSFETYFKDLKSKIEQNIAEKYFKKFYPKGDYGSFFQGADYFQIRKSLKLTDVFDLIDSVEKVLKDEEPSGHNKLVPVGSVKSKTKDFVGDLNNSFLEYIFQNQTTPDVLDCFYIFPKNIPGEIIDSAGFAVAEKGKKDVIKEFDEIPLLSEYVNILMLSGRKEPQPYTTINTFRGSFESHHVRWKISDEEKYDRAFDVFDDLNGVYPYKKKNYLRFNGYWYLMRDNFTQVVDKEFELVLKNKNKFIELPAYLDKWKKNQDENKYNFDYLKKNSVLVAHTVAEKTGKSKLMIKNIEYADLIHLDKRSPKMMHVKKTCSGEMRIAAAQIHQMLTKLNQENRKDFLKEYYDLIGSFKATRGQEKKISKVDFVKLLSSDKLRVCLIMSDDRMKKQPKKLSPLGKFYFVKMFKEATDAGWGDKFCVINV